MENNKGVFSRIKKFFSSSAKNPTAQKCNQINCERCLECEDVALCPKYKKNCMKMDETVKSRKQLLEETVEKEIKKLDESFRLLEMSAKSVNDEAISTKNYLDSEAKKIHRRFFCVIDSLADVVIVKDLQDRWKTANKTTQELFGFKSVYDYYLKTNQEIIDTVPHLKYKNTIKNSGHHDTSVLEQYSKLVKEMNENAEKFEKSENTNFSFRSTDTMNIVDEKTGIKHKIFLDCDRTIIEGDPGIGSETEMIIIGRDITQVIEAKMMNNLCSKALNSASDCIFFIDKTGVITFCNTTFLTTFGYKHPSEVEGQPRTIIESDKHDPAFYGEIWKSISNNKSWSGIIINNTVYKENVEFEANFIPVMNGEPQPIFSICVLKEKKRINEASKRSA